MSSSSSSSSSLTIMIPSNRAIDFSLLDQAAVDADQTILLAGRDLRRLKREYMRRALWEAQQQQQQQPEQRLDAQLSPSSLDDNQDDNVSITCPSVDSQDASTRTLSTRISTSSPFA